MGDEVLKEERKRINYERSIVWEAYNENGCGFAHAHTLKEVRLLIDSDLSYIDDKQGDK